MNDRNTYERESKRRDNYDLIWYVIDAACTIAVVGLALLWIANTVFGWLV